MIGDGILLFTDSHLLGSLIKGNRVLSHLSHPLPEPQIDRFFWVSGTSSRVIPFADSQLSRNTGREVSEQQMLRDKQYSKCSVCLMIDEFFFFFFSFFSSVYWRPVPPPPHRGECCGVVQSTAWSRLRTLQHQPLHRSDHHHLLPGPRAAAALHSQR